MIMVLFCKIINNCMMKKIIFPLLFISTLSYAQQYKNLVLEGGGVRGLAYAGAYSVLYQKGIIDNIENIAGSSAGSIAGLMISLGYTPVEMDSIMRNLKIEKFNDGHWGIIGKVNRFKKEYGLFHGKKYEQWLKELIETKTGNSTTTFLQLHEMRKQNKNIKEFYCTGTNLTQQRTEIFSWKHTPNMMIKTAVRISGSIPIYYKPVILDSLGNEVIKINKGVLYNYYVDGGMVANFPITIFDSCKNGSVLNCIPIKYNKETIGLKLERPEQLPEFPNNTKLTTYPIYNRENYLGAFFNLMQETLQRKSLNLEEEKGRTIYISQGHYSAQIKKMSDDAKNELFSFGKKAVEDFFKN